MLWTNERIGEWTSHHDKMVWLGGDTQESVIRTTFVIDGLRQMRDEYEARITELEAQLAEAQRGQWQPRVMSRSWDGTESGNYTTAPAAPITQDALREAGFRHIANQRPESWMLVANGLHLEVQINDAIRVYVDGETFNGLIERIRTMRDLSKLVELLTGQPLPGEGEGNE